MIRRTHFLRLLPLLLLCTATGCSMGGGDGWRFTKSWDVRRAIGLKKDELAPPQIPTRLVSTWEDAVLNRTGQASQRGFGGRLLFFNAESEDPVRVEGQLVVYAYDEQGRADYETHPTRRFVIPAEQFVRHESECQLGPSYSVWLPWDEVGGEQKDISLIARFEPKGGPLIVGDQTRHLLPGTRQLASGEKAPAVKPVDEIQLTAYSQKSEIELPRSNTKTQPARESKITSISLSGENWEKRLKRAQSSNATAAATEQAPVSEPTRPTTR